MFIKLKRENKIKLNVKEALKGKRNIRKKMQIKKIYRQFIIKMEVGRNSANESDRERINNSRKYIEEGDEKQENKQNQI